MEKSHLFVLIAISEYLSPNKGGVPTADINVGVLWKLRI